MEHIHYEDETTKYICLSPVNKVKHDYFLLLNILKSYIKVECLIIPENFMKKKQFSNSEMNENLVNMFWDFLQFTIRFAFSNGLHIVTQASY
jgi:hypothetical protein